MDHFLHSGPGRLEHLQTAVKELKRKKQVTVLGLGESGLAAALFLKRKGYAVFVTDAGKSPLLEARAADLARAGVPFELGRHTVSRAGACDWALISPGIPPTSDICQSLAANKVPLVSEIELASWFFAGAVTAVTGTTGKTTVVTLLDRIFRANGLRSLACGNIGNPWVGELDRLPPEAQVVLEVSSFQLMHTYSLRPRSAILLNIGRNHLDWHADMKDYVKAKLRLFANQTAEDRAFFRRQDRTDFFPDFKFRAETFEFGGDPSLDSNAELLRLLTRLEKLDPAKTEEILKRFEGIEHRLERVAETGGVLFVNDSKSTTIEALAWALERFPDGKVILLAGGHAKGADFRCVRDRLQHKAKKAVVFGESQGLLWESWEGAAPLARAADLAEAFQEALKTAETGDVILLSPACASFDQFANYKERGRLFKELIRQELSRQAVKA